MSSVTILCPNGHRQKVATTPNMSILQVLETVCAKKGFDPATHRLQHHRKLLDTSTTVRFSGLPNNAQLELVEVEAASSSSSAANNVTVCLQAPSGQRLIGEFSDTTCLDTVLAKWTAEDLGQPEQGEEPVLVYMRREMVGMNELKKTTLRTLGLTQGKGLFRFFYKKPELLKEQANVYDLKVPDRKPENEEEKAHRPMRLEPATLSSLATSDSTATSEHAEVTVATAAAADVTAAASAVTVEATVPTPSSTTEQENSSAAAVDVSAVAGPGSVQAPDSTIQEEQPVVNYVGPHGGALIFPLQSGGGAAFAVTDDDLDDDFFDLKLEDVKGLYRDLRLAVKEQEEGGLLLTKEMREAQREGQKLALLARYKSCVLRIQFPSRHIVQGVFSPATTIGEVHRWLEPLLRVPERPFELYTAPPRTVLAETATLLDLQLCPAALVHFASRVTTGDTDHLHEEWLLQVSNMAGANQEAGQHRRAASRRIQASASKQEATFESGGGGSSSSSSVRLNKRMAEPEQQQQQQASSSSSSLPGSKKPKWFKP